MGVTTRAECSSEPWPGFSEKRQQTGIWLFLQPELSDQKLKSIQRTEVKTEPIVHWDFRDMKNCRIQWLTLEFPT